MVEPIIQDSQGTIWFTRGQRGPEDTEGPLCDIRATELLCHGQNDGVPFRDAQALAEDRDGAIWAGSRTQLICWKQGNYWTNSHHGFKFFGRPQWHLSIIPGKDGGMWVGCPLPAQDWVYSKLRIVRGRQSGVRGSTAAGLMHLCCIETVKEHSDWHGGSWSVSHKRRSRGSLRYNRWSLGRPLYWFPVGDPPFMCRVAEPTFLRSSVHRIVEVVARLVEEGLLYRVGRLT